MANPKKLILLELNELNFEYLEYYISLGYLPHFTRFFREHGYQETRSETDPQNLEPWIQWVSIHTGKPFAQHRVFRLGDTAEWELPQIWEYLEREKGLKVGAISPMNATNRLRNPAFFLPDPWTQTRPAGSFLLQKVHEAIAQTVNENAQNKINFKSGVYLTAGLWYTNKKDGCRYGRELFRSLRSRWFRAIFLDRFLSDIFLKLWKKKKPDFSSLFLNAAAHIQHHYLFNAKAYSGPNKNPPWYAKPDCDPLLDVYLLYDEILGKIRALGSREELRIMMATGLHQKPYEKVAHYYRLKNHAQFLKGLGVPFTSVEPRMSRDFLIQCASDHDAVKAESDLKGVTDDCGTQIFEVDNRGRSLFVTLSYPQEIRNGFVAHASGKRVHDFSRQVAFVALKNADHDGKGYFSDSACSAPESNKPFNVWEIYDKIRSAF